jgi:hypothetical protein
MKTKLRKLYHYKCGLVGMFATEELGITFMRDLGGVFKWDEPFTISDLI